MSTMSSIAIATHDTPTYMYAFLLDPQMGTQSDSMPMGMTNKLGAKKRTLMATTTLAGAFRYAWKTGRPSE